MTPEERRFLRTVYHKAERARARRARLCARALLLLGALASAAACVLLRGDMLLVALLGTVGLSLLCGHEWLQLHAE